MPCCSSHRTFNAGLLKAHFVVLLVLVSHAAPLSDFRIPVWWERPWQGTSVGAWPTFQSYLSNPRAIGAFDVDAPALLRRFDSAAASAASTPCTQRRAAATR
jgi:hypothetical protein